MDGLGVTGWAVEDMAGPPIYNDRPTIPTPGLNHAYRWVDIGPVSPGINSDVG